jgi:hypothetical protein
MDLGEARATLGGQWSAFVGAVYDPEIRAQAGGVQQYVWAAVRDYYLSRSEPLPARSFEAVNALLSLAGEQRQAGLNLSRSLATFERTGIDQSIDSGHIAPSIDSRPLNAQLGGAQHRAIYLSQELVDGEPVLSYRTHDFGFNLPQSVSALNDAIESAAQVEAADYGYEWGGVATPIAIHSY